MPVSLLFAIEASLALTVFGLGLRATPEDVLYLRRRPSLFARSVLAMNVITPLFVLLVATGFDLPPAIRLGLVALTLSPAPPTLPAGTFNASGEGSYAIASMIGASLLAVITLPATLGMVSGFNAALMDVDIPTVGRIVFGGVVLPFAIGVWVNRVAPRWADNCYDAVVSLAGVLLLVGVIALAAFSWSAIASLASDVTMLAVVAATGTALIIGHLLGGPKPNDRTVLAVATSSRHPAIALIIVDQVFPGDHTAIGVVMLSLGAGALASMAHATWRRRRTRGRTITAPSH